MPVAIIPARGGSKRIPGKNIKDFCGKPIIAYSIEAAKETGLFDKIIVSTDSDKIAEISKETGAEVPFMRLKELADDYTDTVSVILHALKWLREHKELPEYSCCIYATVPFIQAEYIKQGFEELQKNNADTCFSVTTFPYPVFRALKINKKGNLEMLWDEYYDKRSQDMPETYHDAGQFYWFNTKKILQDKKIFAKYSLPVILPRYLVQDIDTFEDWENAELMFKFFKSSGIY